MKERGRYRVAALLDGTYEVRTPAGEWFHIVRTTRVANRAMRLELSGGTTAVYPTDVPLFSRRTEEPSRGWTPRPPRDSARPLAGDQPERAAVSFDAAHVRYVPERLKDE